MAKRLVEILADIPPGDFTFAMIKPDGMAKAKDEVLKAIRHAGFTVLRSKVLTLSELDAKVLYHQHIGRSYFKENCAFVRSGQVQVMILRKRDAVEDWRKLMGPSDSSTAGPSTLRGKFGNPNVVRENVVQGADSPTAAMREAAYFFT